MEINQVINQEAVIQLLKALVEIPSPYFEEYEIMQYVFKWFINEDLPISYHNYHEKKLTDLQGVNIFGEIQGGKEGPTILLNGHLDTVRLCSNWRMNPFKVNILGDKMYGLGILDMKSGCVAIMLALKAFYKKYNQFNGRIVYTFVSDEEGPYGLGTNFLIEDNVLGDIDVAIIPEPSPSFTKHDFPTLCLGARGGYAYKIQLFGLAAHAADPESGINAIEEGAKLILELQNTEFISDSELGKGSICVTEISGGGDACSVADTAVISVFRHIVMGETKATIINEVTEAAKRANIKCKYSIEFREAPLPNIDGFMPYKVSKDNDYVKKFIEVAERTTSKKIDIAYFSSIGDFNTIASRLNIPTFVFGPNGENGHSCDEYVYIADVVDTALTIYHYLEGLLI